MQYKNTKHILQTGILHPDCILDCIFFSSDRENKVLSTFVQRSHLLNLLSLCLSQAYLCPPWNPNFITLLYLRPHHFQLNYLHHLMYYFLLNFVQSETECESINLLTGKKHQIQSHLLLYCCYEESWRFGGFWTLQKSYKYTSSQLQMSCFLWSRELLSPIKEWSWKFSHSPETTPFLPAWFLTRGKWSGPWNGCYFMNS